MKNIVEPIKNKKTLSKIENHLALKSKRNQLIWAFGVNSGLRVSDILGLNVEDVKNKTYIEIREKKTGKYKKFPLNKKLRNLVKNYLKKENLTNGALFIGKKHHRLHRSQVYRFLNEACKTLGVEENIGTHTMRKSFGFHFYKQYNNIALLQKILNHSTPTVTLRYIGIDQEEIDVSYKNFEL